MKQTTNDNIRDLIRKIAKDPTAEIYSIAIKITAVDETERTCDGEPLNGDAEIFGIRLQSIINGADGFCLIPKVGSVGIVTFINKATGYLALISSVDKMIVKSETQIAIDCDEIIFNGGSNDGFVKVGDLVSKLNAVESDLNKLKNIFTAWIPVPQDGGGALKTASASWAGQTITPTQQTDLENTKIKH